MAPLGTNTAIVISKRCENEFKRNRNNVQRLISTFSLMNFLMSRYAHNLYKSKISFETVEMIPFYQRFQTRSNLFRLCLKYLGYVTVHLSARYITTLKMSRGM